MDEQIHQARSEYLSAAIDEINNICNAVANTREDLSAVLLERAETSGLLAQTKFEEFFSLVQTYKASKENEG